ALVRAVLSRTDSDNRLTHAQVWDGVRRILPSHPAKKVEQYTDAALKRLDKRVVRHWPIDDSYCLTYDERLSLKERLAELQRMDTAYLEDLAGLVAQTIAPLPHSSGVNVPDVVVRMRRILECFLLERGEFFASAVSSGTLNRLNLASLSSVAESDLLKFPEDHGVGPDLHKLCVGVLAELVTGPFPNAQHYMRRLADSYTLFAFLQETPDVQSAVRKLFAEGDVWLDATVVLPILAEDLIEPEARRWTSLVKAATTAGLKLFVTPGVLEEVDRHMSRCLKFARSGPGKWHGGVPFLASVFAFSGRSLGAFASWIETFRGEARPLDDLADYVGRFFDVRVESLEKEADKAPSDLRYAIQEAWHQIHEQRRGSVDIDPAATARLVQHDVENYLGVIERRKGDRSNPLGYTCWW